MIMISEDKVSFTYKKNINNGLFLFPVGIRYFTVTSNNKNL